MFGFKWELTANQQAKLTLILVYKGFRRTCVINQITNSAAPEPEGSSPHSQQPATGPYPEPGESILHPSANLPKVHFDPILPSTPRSFKWSLSLWLLTRTLYTFSLLPCVPHTLPTSLTVLRRLYMKAVTFLTTMYDSNVQYMNKFSPLLHLSTLEPEISCLCRTIWLRHRIYLTFCLWVVRRPYKLEFNEAKICFILCHEIVFPLLKAKGLCQKNL
jgi:hypothetical protein